MCILRSPLLLLVIFFDFPFGIRSQNAAICPTGYEFFGNLYNDGVTDRTWSNYKVVAKVCVQHRCSESKICFYTKAEKEIYLPSAISDRWFRDYSSSAIDSSSAKRYVAYPLLLPLQGTSIAVTAPGFNEEWACYSVPNSTITATKTLDQVELRTLYITGSKKKFASTGNCARRILRRCLKKRFMTLEVCDLVVTPTTSSPTSVPTQVPTVRPTKLPTSLPTKRPTARPTPRPTSKPTKSPTRVPTKNPTKAPTLSPTFLKDQCKLSNGSLRNCYDGNPATIDVCYPATGCAFLSQLPDTPPPPLPLPGGDGVTRIYTYQDQPNIPSSTVDAIVNWLRSEVSQVKNPFCWRQSYGRTAGVPLSTCPPDRDQIGALCYSKCPSGYYRFGFDCHQSCKPGWRDDGLYCRLAEQPSGCFTCSCPAGWTWVLWICRPPVPDCAAEGYNSFGQVDLSCPKIIRIGDPTPLVCASGLQQDGGLCYPYCSGGFHGVGPVCWQDCDTDQVDCGAACAKTTTDCATVTTDLVLAPLIVAANIATLGLTSVAAGTANAVRVGSKFILVSASVGPRAALVARTMLKLLDKTQTITSAKGVKYIDRLLDWKVGSPSSVVYSGLDYGYDLYVASSNFYEAASSNFDVMTSAAIAAKLDQNLSPATAKYIKILWATIQFKEIASAFDWQVAGSALDFVSMVDITGITGVVAAYAKPICRTVVPFPPLP